MSAPTKSLIGLAALAVAGSGCEEKRPPAEERGPPPPTVASSAPGICAKGPGKLSDAVSAGFFPPTSAGYCVDPNGTVQAYGDQAPGSVDKVCTEQFDGECEVYKSYGLSRVVTLRYVDDGGSTGTVNVTLSRFKTVEGAYGFFTKRVIADADPAETKPEPLAAGGAGQLGGSNANVWRGDYVLELAYSNEREAPDALRKTTGRVVPPLAKAIAEKLPGSVGLPPAAAALPAEDRLPLGIAYVLDEALGVKGAGAAAIGYYAKDGRRWRVFAAVRQDEEGAKDLLKALKKVPGATGLAGVTFDAASLTLRADEESPRVEWVMGRKGTSVLGIGDEEAVLSSDMTPADAAKVRLDAGTKVERLRALVGG